MARTVIRGGTLVTAQGRYEAELECEDGLVERVGVPGSAGPGDEEIDARGLLVFPGFIDPHVHSRDPGLTHKEDFAHSTRAAAAGGVTTLFEMPNAVPPVSTPAIFGDRAESHARSAFVDFGLWAISLGPDNIDQLPALVEEGAVGVKLFWGYALDRATKQLVYNLNDQAAEDLILPPGNGDVYDIFKTMAETGGLLAAHCEDREIIEASQRSVSREGSLDGYDAFLAGRPDTAEAATIAVGIELARATGCRFHVVHTSSARGLELIRSAQREGVAISAETCPQYLTMTDETFETVGPMMKVYPPIRRRTDLQELWAGVLDGTISSLGSDHAPHTTDEKQGTLESAPAGAVGVETMVPVLLNEMTRGRITPERLAWALSEGTARLYGVHPQKGSLLPGTDADLTLVDPEARWKISDEGLHSKHSLSPWNGCEGRGAPVVGVVRGEVVMRDGEPVGEPRGRLVRPRRQGDANGSGR